MGRVGFCSAVVVGRVGSLSVVAVLIALVIATVHVVRELDARQDDLCRADVPRAARSGDDQVRQRRGRAVRAPARRSGRGREAHAISGVGVSGAAGGDQQCGGNEKRDPTYSFHASSGDTSDTAILRNTTSTSLERNE